MGNMKKEVLISSYSNVTKEGIVLHLTDKAKLKTGNIATDEFWVSWDKIGEALFDSYHIGGSVADKKIIREASKQK